MAKKKKVEIPERKVVWHIQDDGSVSPIIQNQNQDIAPVQTKQSGFFKSSDAKNNWSIETDNPFMNAVQRANATLWGTILDAGTNVVRGATSSVEGIGDFAQNRVADVQDLFGHSKAAEKTRRKSEQVWGINQKIDDFDSIMNTTSVLGDKSDAVFQGVGTSLFAMGTGALGGAIGGTNAAASILSLGTMGLGAAGNSENQARQEMMADLKKYGFNTKQINNASRMYGLLSGVGETLSEMMFGGISQTSKVLGIGSGVFDSADDAVINALTKRLKTGIFKNFVQAGLKASGEGVEEIASGFLDAAAKKLTYMKDEDFGKLLKDEKLLDSFISGTLSATITQMPSVFKSVTTRQNGKLSLKSNNEIRDFVSNLNTQEQQVVEREIENRLAQEENPTNKRRMQIEKQVIEDLDRGYISANTIRETLGENYNPERDLRLNESFNEETRRSQAYENDLSKYDEKQRKTIQKAIDSGLLNNSNKTHDFVDLIAKISADKGVDFDFTNNERIKESGFAIDGKQVNGFIQDGKVTLNLESNQALNKTVGHEITHVLEGTELYNSLQDSLKSFIGEREWNNRISELEKTYKGVKGANIENELTSDLVGEYVFNDESFVRNLSTRNQNLFQKIFDEIKYLVKVATAGSKEARELEKAKKVFEKAYRDASKTSTEGKTQYSVKESKKMLENQFKELTGDSMLVAEAKLGNYAFQQIQGREVEAPYSKEAMDLYEKIQNSKQTSSHLYHSTPVDRIQSILQNGLQVGSQQNQEGVSSTDKLYLSATEELADSFTPNDSVMLRISPNANLENLDYDLLGGEGSYTITNNIDPKYLQVKENGKWVNLTKSQYAKQNNQNTRYSLSEDNNGRKLTEAQNEYFKDSKARDDNGNLVTVYHTTTDKVAQFNEFDPTGTDYYKFGDQVVNYFTDDKNMSGSYADQYYEMADTKKLTSIEEVNEYLKQFNDSFNTEYNPSGNADYVVREENGKYNVYNDVEKGIIDSANDFISTLNQEEKDFIKKYIQDGASKTLFEDRYGLTPEQEEHIKKYENWAFNQYSPKSLSKAPQNYLAMLLMDTYNNRPIASYDSKEQLFRNIRTDLEVENYDKRSRLQYEGYVNLTNPYVIDAEGRTWNKVESKADSDLTKRLLEVTEEDRRYLESLASDSIKTYNDNLFNYQQADRAINDFAVDRTNTTLEQRLIHRTIHDLGFEDFMKVLNNEDVYWGRKEQFMDDAFNNGFATLKQREEYNKTGNIPAEVLEKVDKLIHEPVKYEDRYMRKELEALGMPPEIKTTTIYDLWNNQQQTYKTFDEGGRYEYSKFNQQVNERNLYRALGNEELFKVAKRGFTDENVRLLYNDWSVTNDIVKKIIDLNKYGENYDGVIMKNVIDYGGESEVHTPHDLYITFNSNQFKAVDNLNPTNDADIRYQLGQQQDTNGWEIRSEDVRLQSAFQNTIAPLQEQVQELSNTINELKDNISPLRAMTEEEANEYATQTQEAFENEPAPIRNNLTEEENQRMNMLELLERNNMLTDEQRSEMNQLENKINPTYEEEVSPVRELSDIRDINEVGKRNVKAYQYEHPEVKPYFQEEARVLLSELDNSTKAERFVTERNDSMYGDWHGIRRNTSPDIAAMLDGELGTNYTYDDIRKGLNAIIEDHGAENIAVAKRIEFVLDERLRNGYDAWGVFDENGEQYHVEPNQDYLNMLAEQEWQNYFDDINSQYPLEQLQEPQYNLEDEETDFSDVSIDNDIQNMTADDINIEPFLQGLVKSGENQAERQQLRNELNEKREVKVPKNPELNKAKNRGLGLLVNEFAEIDDYSKRTGNKNIKFKADTYNNYQAIAQSNIETAQTDINGKAIGRSGNSIFEEAKSLGLEDTFDEYLKQWANVDRAKQGKGAANYSAKESYKIVKEMEAKNPRLKKLGNDMWQYYRNARHNLRDAGIISQEVSDMLGRMYPHYTPYISENIENYFTDKGELKPKATIKRAKGGAAIGSLLSAEEAMQRYTKSEFNTIFGNDLFKEIVKTSNDIVQLGGDDRGMQFVNADNLYADKNGYYLTAYENGNPITAKISEDMYRTLTRESRNRIGDIENTFSAVTKPLQAASNIRRNILTSWSPTFMAKNFIKDFQEGIFNSKYTKDFIKNYPSAFKELATNTELAQQFKSLYGSGLTMGQYDIDANNYNPSGKNRNFLKGIKNVNELIELAPRYAEFKASIDHGASIQEAMYNAREVTTNFSRGGTLAKALNRNGFTFLNSSIQGFDKFIRNFSGENGAKGIVNSLAKAAIFGIAPAVFNELAFGSGDDKDEEYEALPDYIKDNYYIIKTGDGNFIRIPKGRVFSVFGSAARRTIEAMEGEENSFEGYWNNVQQQIGINNPEENNIFAPLIQAMGGRKLDSGQTAGEAWYGGDIIPSRLQKERPEDQYDASIDKFSIWLGQRTGISPYKINYVLDQYSGGMGDIFLPTITPEANSDGSIIAPIKDQFTADSTTDNKYVSEFYDTKGKIYTGSKATDEDVLKNKYMNSISSEMAKLYAERREIQSDESLTKKQKYAKSQAIKVEINRLAKEGMDNYNNIISSNNYAKIGDTEYYKNANGQWTKVTDDVASLGLDTEEKSEYYKVKNDIYTTKKENDGYDKPLVVQDIVNSNLTPEAKVSLYTSNYKDDLIQPLVDSGMDVDSYLTYKAQNFTADKDKNGKSISGSKKQKIFDYINSMAIPYEQKLILAKSEYNSFNDNNYEIIEYIENSGMDYSERIELYKNLGFKVDGDNISW